MPKTAATATATDSCRCTTTRARKANQGSKWLRPSLRFSLYLRDSFSCAYCCKSAETHGIKLTIDHVLACELGGCNCPTNLVTVCLSCNSAKQDLTMRQWLAYLRTARKIDTSKIAARVRRIVSKPLDRAAGLAMVKAREAGKSASL